MRTINRRTASRFRTVTVAISTTALFASLLFLAPTSATAVGPGTIDGTVFVDENQNGANDSEAGLAGVTVSAYDADNALAATTTTGGSGTYSLGGLTDGVEYRIEFTGIPSGYLSGPRGTDSETAVTFATPEVTGVDFGVVDEIVCTGSLPAGALLTTYNTAANCGVLADAATYPQDSFGLLDVSNLVPATGRSDQTGSTPMLHQVNWEIGPLGNTFGTTIDSYRGDIYLAASSNFSSGLYSDNPHSLRPSTVQYGTIGGGANDLGAAGTVYQLDAVTGTPTVFAQLPQQSASLTHSNCDGFAGGDINRTTGVGLGNAIYDPVYDQMFVANWEDGHIYRLDMAGNVLDAYDPDASDNGSAGLANGDVPYGLALDATSTRLFWGNLFNQEIWSVDLTAGTFTGSSSVNGNGDTIYENDASETLNIILNTNIPPDSNYIDPTWYPPSARDYHMADLELLPSGEMLVGIRMGCDGNINTGYNHYGQTRVLTADGSGFYTSQSAALDITVIQGTENNWAEEDNYGGVAHYVRPDTSVDYVVSTADFLSENGPHGIAAFNEADRFDTPVDPGGVAAYGVGDDPKGIGGDVQTFNAVTCPKPRIEIGNYVWLDADADGVQDPGELPLEGVTVTLYASDGSTVLATTTTGADGEYVFTALDGVDVATSYEIGFDVSTNVTALPGGFGNGDLSETIADNGSGPNADAHDSDLSSGRIVLTTGQATDHTFDAGYALPGFDLALTKTVSSGPSPVLLGAPVVFDITITNQGAPVETIEVTDYVEAGAFTYDVADNPAGSVNDDGDLDSFTYTWSPGAVLTIVGAELDTGESVTVPLTLDVDPGFAGGVTLENWAEISNFDSDQNAANGDASDGTLVDTDSTPDAIDGSDGSQNAGEDPLQAHVDDEINENGKTGGDEDDHDIAVLKWYDLTLIKTRNAAQPFALDLSASPPTALFDISVGNQGPYTATAIQVTDFLPPGTAVSATQPSMPTQTTLLAPVTITETAPTYLIDQLGPGDDVTFSIQLDITDPALSPFVNAAEISAFLGEDGEVASDIDSIPDAVNTDPVIPDPLNPDDPGNSHNDLGYDPDTDGNLNEPTPGDEDDHDAEIVVAEFDLALRKTVNAGSANVPGGPITFDLTVVNQGRPVQTITITDYVPTGLLYSVADNPGGSVNDDGDGDSLSYTWSPGSAVATIQGVALDPGESVTIPLVLQVDPTWDGSDIANWAEISNFDNDLDPGNGDASDGSLSDADSTPDAIDGSDGSQNAGEDPLRTHVDDEIDESGNAGDDEDDHDVAHVLWHDLTLIKVRALGQPFTVDISGSPPTATFTITVGNQGNLDATSIQVIDYVPTGMAVAASQPSMPTLTDLGAAVTITETAPTYVIDALAADDSVSFDIVLEVTDLGVPEFVNAAEITAFNDAGGAPATDVDSTPDSVNSDPVIDDPLNPDDPGNSHNDINYDPDGDGNVHEPTPGDEDDHGAEIVVIVYAPDIDIEKDTNGVQADTGTGPLIIPGNPVTWTFDVTNTGNTDLADVVVVDTVTIDNGTAAGTISCDWAGSSDPLTPDRNLSVGETVTCTATSTSVAGQYANESDVSGVPVADAVTADPDNPVRLLDAGGNPVPDATDTDPSAYFGPAASIDIEKDTNGNQADTIPAQDSYTIGDPLTWTFDVINDGNVDLAAVTVSDTVTIDNGTVASAISCDWAGSSDPLTPAGNLSVGETVSCTSTSNARAGQYGNLGDVVGTPVDDAVTADPVNPTPLQDEGGNDLPDVTDTDPSHYYGIPLPAIDIEKATNGNDADTLGAQDIVPIGNAVVWTFVVTNSGNVDLADVRVNDVVTIDNGTTPDPGGVVCDWAGSSDPTTPARNLSVGETVTCTSSSTAVPGQYRNDADVAGTPVADAVTADPDAPVRLQDIGGNDLPDVIDADPSHYYGQAIPSIDIEKDTNGFDADTGTGPLVFVGDPVTWTFVVQNTGNVPLGTVTVTDVVTVDNGTVPDPGGVVCDWAGSSDGSTPAGELSPGETVTCTSASVAAAGQYRNNSNVSGAPLAVDGSGLLGPDGLPLPNVTDQDPSAYFGPTASIDIDKDTNGNQADTIPAQDLLPLGTPVTWTFVVINDGNTDLGGVTVSDTVTIDNGTTAGSITCDWAGSSDASTPAGNLSVGETVSCTSSSTAEPGQYGNLGDVVGTPVEDATDPTPTTLLDEGGNPLPDVTDTDPSHHYGVATPSIDIEKDTNGVQADTGTGPLVLLGNAVDWTFVVQNTGDVSLGSVTVTDTVTVDNGTTPDPGGVVCDWAGSSDVLTPAGTLSPGETVTCTSASTAVAGQYRNDGDVVGTPLANDGSTLLDPAGNPVADVTDNDPSGYFGPSASIDIEKDTNGNQADTIPAQDSYSVGAALTWTFDVINDGNVDLAAVTVSDTVTIDNGTAAGTISCDWAGSSDALTPAGNLSVGETVSCTSSSTAEAGQYGNLGDVVGTPVDNAITADPVNPTPLQDEGGNDLPDVTDTDPSHYFGTAAPAIDIEKDTNGNQADTIPAQDSYSIGAALTWTFDVTNTGDVDLAAVTVGDAVTIDNGTAAGTISCDWAGSSDALTPAGNLSVGETVSCTSSSTAEAGQYGNLGDVVGTPVADAVTADPVNPTPLQDIGGNDLPDVTDTDPSHYFGTAAPAIDIEKDTNGNQADTIPAQDQLAIGTPVTWTFVVANTGDVDLAAVAVSDTVTIDNGTAAGSITCDWAGSSDASTPAGNLSVGETVSCTSASTAVAGQYGNLGDVVGTPVDDATDPAPTTLLDVSGNPLPDVTDTDPSHYYGLGAPSIDIEKDTNGIQADTGTGPLVLAGNAVDWTFVVQNTGDVSLGSVTVNDTVTVDNGTTPDPGGVVCDWAGSSDAGTPAGTLSPGETVTCTSASTAVAGQYRNDGDVVGTPLDGAGSPLLDPTGNPVADVTDNDPSGYFGPDASIDIEKDTNGNQADTIPAQDTYTVGDPITWSFVVVNDGNVDLAAVTVSDTVTIDNATTPDPAGVVCDWAGSSDALTPAGNLSVGETVTCTSSSTAAAGQYGNLGDVVGTPVDDAITADPVNPTPLQDEGGNDLADVTDTDPSHYFGDPIPSIDIEKDTNGNQADTIPAQDIIPIGAPITWTFVVTNTGNTDLAAVVVGDTVTIDNGTAAGSITCDWAGSSDAATPAGNLSVGETVSCTATSTAVAGQYGNLSDVVGTPVANAVTADPVNPTPLQDIGGNDLADVTDTDPSHYFGQALPAVDIEKDTNGFQADTGTGPLIFPADPVTWTYVVTNVGNATLGNVTVTDIVTIDNGTTAGTISCDWAGSSDASTPAGELSVGETVTCTATSTAEQGQYANDSTVTGTPLDEFGNPLLDSGGNPVPDVTDSDPSAYFGPIASIDIEKDTNGNQADTIPAQDSLSVGTPITWTFVVTNDGNVGLSGVAVNDIVTIDNGTAAGSISCDWVGSSDAATPPGNLSVGETVTCTATSTAEAGQYGNLSDVVATPVADPITSDPGNPTPLQDETGTDLPDVTDTDPSHYFGAAAPAIDIEKDTNGNQADTILAQDSYNLGDAITWTFVVTNTGDVDLAAVAVNDTVTIDNSTTPGAITCDWAGSSDAATPAGNLSVGETVTCTSSSTAAAGQYGNLGDVVGTPVADAVTADPVNPTPLQDIGGNDLPDVTDTDPSHYYGQALPSIDIEKDTNGVDADTGTGPLVIPGNPVTWTFVVQNTGNVSLGTVTVTDTVTVDNGTTPDPGGVVCDWAGSSDGSTPAGTLSPGETVTCTAASTAVTDQYRNDSNVSGAPLAADGSGLLGPDGLPLPNVTDQDPSGYFGPAASIDIEKDTNGNQADTIPAQDSYAVGDPITWTFVIVNDGNVDLSGVDVTDGVTIDNLTVAGIVVCDWAGSSDAATPAGNLSVGETVTCTSSSTAEAGQYGNQGDVEATPVDDATTADPGNPTPLQDESGTDLPDVNDADPSHYFGAAAPAIDIEKDTNGNQADTIPAQDTLPLSSAVTWTFVVTNTGDVGLAEVAVGDIVTIDNGTAAGTISCDWAGSSDAATPADNLSVGETVTCTSSSSAEAGQYGNLSDVVGTPVADAVTADPVNPTPLQDIGGNDLADVTDTDPSHYFGDFIPAVDIEKDTNGFDADTGTGPLVLVGNPVTWTFVVTNNGNTALGNVTVTDAVTVDNGTVAGTVTCDWANSSDASTPAGELSVGETVTCTSSSTAVAGQYRNLATVTGSPLEADGTPLLDISGNPVPDVTDDDPSGYFGPVATIDIEKDTNGNDADTIPAQDVLTIGGAVTWTFVVTNTGNVDLAAVDVADTVTIDNGTAAGTISCDWAGSSDAATPAGNLSAGETVSCTSSSTVEAGQYGNLSDVVGTPVADAVTADPVNPTPLQDEGGNDLADVTDTDPSHYFGDPIPSIDIEKDTNGNQADTIPEQANLAIGDPVTWTFVVVNTGNVDLAAVTVSDSVTIDNGTIAGTISCDWAGSSDAATPAGNLSVGETVTCTSSSTVVDGQYGNLGDVVGTPVADAVTADPVNPTPLQDIGGNDLADVTDADPSHYFGAESAILIEKDTNGNQADTIPEQDFIDAGTPVTWTFVVTNTGSVDLADVRVSDAVVIDNLTVAGTISCDWAGSSDAATPARNLSVDETVTCTSSSTAAAGQYGNLASVIGTPVADATTADPDNPVQLTGPGGELIPEPTDDDPSHYFGAAAEVDVEKETNGNQADAIADQDTISIGDPVTWTFVLENTGNVDLSDVVVTDAVTIDNGTAPGAITCDWAGSSDPATPADRLSVGETVTCTSASTSVAGQYGNLATVVGQPVEDATDPTPVPLPSPPVSDDDPSHYFGGTAPAIDIEKDTNGNDADLIDDQDVIPVGDPVTWTFVVTNDGDTDLASVVVSDTVEIDNGTVADPAGVVCDWANSSDPATPADALSVDESVTCTSSSSASAGQYRNVGDVIGTPVVDATDPNPVPLTDTAGDPLPPVTDDDPSHYFGGLTSVDIEKDTNGNDADTPAEQDQLAVGGPVTWTFVVTNTGNVDLGSVVVTDAVTIDNGTAAGAVACDWANSSNPATPAGNLATGESVTCTSTSVSAPGQYGNLATVTGTPIEDADDPTPTPLPFPPVEDDDPSHYFGASSPSIDIEKATNGVDADTIAEQGSVDVGGDLTWTFVVTNDGDVDLADIVVADTVTIDNGTTMDPAGIVCDWDATADASTPAGTLAVGETVTCTAAGTAGAGQYGNLGDVTATPVRDASAGPPVPLTDTNGDPLPPVTDDDPSHVFAGSRPAIDIEKDTNGNDADTIAEGWYIAVDEPLTFTFVVTNIGNVDLADVVVTDSVTIDNGSPPDPDGVVCDWAGSSDAASAEGRLTVGETVTCTATSTATPDQYGNLGGVTGTPVDDGTVDDPEPLTDIDGDPLPPVTDEDRSHYFAPVFDLALRKQLDDGTNLAVVEPNELVTFTITIFNQGNVPATNIEIVDYLPSGLELADPDWTPTDSGATTTLDGVTLAPGESTTVDITVRVVGGADGTELETEAEISEADPVTTDGDPIPLVSATGDPLVLVDIDSVPDATNDENPVEDEINNDQGDEDDHDRAGVIISRSTEVPPVVPSTSPPLQFPPLTTPPAPPADPPAPEPLAHTGTESNRLASIGFVVMALGGVILVGGSRMRRDEDDEGPIFG